MVLRALTVTQDDALRSQCSQLLTDQGFSVTAVPDSNLALEAVRQQQPQVVVLGFTHVDASSGQLVRALRRYSDAYVLVVRGDDQGANAAEPLEAAVDDVLHAPLDASHLRARLDVLKSRSHTSASLGPEQRVFGDLVIDVAAREVFHRGRVVDLTRIEFDLLRRLSDVPRRVLSRDQLIETIWGLEWYSDGHLLDVHIGNLRQKLGESGRRQHYIQTVRSVGFRFNPHPGSAGIQAVPADTEGQLSLSSQDR